MKDGLFHFKQFSVSHSRSSMKVGVDGVLIGMWARVCGGRVLDAGTGCGVIALMLAQRDSTAIIEGIDIDGDSIAEASENFAASPWSDRLSAGKVPFGASGAGKLYDLIVSNPPFFDSGVASLSTSREKARHVGMLSPDVLIEKSPGLLREGGRLALIAPADNFRHLASFAAAVGLKPERALFVRNHAEAKVKRVMMEFVKTGEEPVENKLREEEIPVLTMFGKDGEPTDDYRRMGAPFYLKF